MCVFLHCCARDKLEEGGLRTCSQRKMQQQQSPASVQTASTTNSSPNSSADQQSYADDEFSERYPSHRNNDAQADEQPKHVVDPAEIIDVLSLLQILMGILYIGFCLLALLRWRDVPDGKGRKIPSNHLLIAHVIEGSVMVTAGYVNRECVLKSICCNFFWSRIMSRSSAVVLNIGILAWNLLEISWPKKRAFQTFLCLCCVILHCRFFALRRGGGRNMGDGCDRVAVLHDHDLLYRKSY